MNLLKEMKELIQTFDHFNEPKLADVVRGWKTEVEKMTEVNDRQYNTIKELQHEDMFKAKAIAALEDAAKRDESFYDGLPMLTDLTQVEDEAAYNAMEASMDDNPVEFKLDESVTMAETHAILDFWLSGGIPDIIFVYDPPSFDLVVLENDEQWK